MLTEHKGDLFTSGANILGHGVNCQGVMGAGIAKIFKQKYPKMYESYKEVCSNDELLPGEVYWYKAEPGLLVLNIASQNRTGADASYDWLVAGMIESIRIVQFWAAKRSVHNLETRFAIPRIGCGIGGLDWDIVKPILSAISEKYKFDIEVWSFDD